jgi:hypothetical protein
MRWGGFMTSMGKAEMHTGYHEEPEGNSNLEELDVDRRIVLK